MRETRTLEYKEAITNTFLKTVSAYSNYDGGTILFGVDDAGEIKGPRQACLDIENKINDNITPQPDYMLEIIDRDQIVKLTVRSGFKKPYLYRSKAYKRSDSATVEVDRLELSRLILEGMNRSFEELPYKDQNLSFTILQCKLKERIQLETFNEDTLKTLNLYDTSTGYNNAAGILADQNDFLGIDIVRFGETINTIQKRFTFDRISILDQYDQAMRVFYEEYQYEEIKGTVRNRISKIPEEAIREAVANALIHRVWDVDARIRVLMFDDRIEIVSPGGLPTGIQEEDYLSGMISVLRNRNLANVFYRLGFVEIFGTGITRIKKAYEDSLIKPEFHLSESAIRVILPVFEKDLKLSEDERVVYKTLSATIRKSIGEIVTDVPFGKSKLSQLLKKLEQKGIVVIEGNGRGTRYRLK